MNALKRALAAMGFRSASPGATAPGRAAERAGFAAAGRRQPLWLAYSLPFITTAVTLLVVEAAARGEPVNTPVIVFVLPILLSAYAGGQVPGLLSTLLSTLATVYFVLPPVNTWSVASPNDNIKWITLAATGTLMSFLMGHRERPGTEPLAQHSRPAGSLLLSAQRRVQAGFAVLLTCLIAMAAVSYPMLVRLRQDTGQVEHTYQVIATLRLLISSATDAETGERGYIITGKKEFLEPCHSGLQGVNHALSEARRLTKDNPEQQRRLDVLEPIIAERLAILKEGIERRDQAFSSAQAFVSSGPGQQLQDRIREAVAEMEASEKALLAKQEGIEQRAGVVAKIVIVGGSALAVLIVAVALWMIGKAFNVSRDAETALQESHHLLETRVKERTSELLQERDRLSASEEKFAKAFATNPAAVAIASLEDGLFLDVNSAWEAMTGNDRREAIGGYVKDLANWPTPEDRVRFVTELKEKGLIQLQEQMFLRRGGEPYTALFSAVVLNVGGQQAVISTLLDTTEQKKAAEALRRQAELLRLSFDPIISWRLDGAIESWNAGAEKVYGFTESEALGRMTRELLATVFPRPWSEIRAELVEKCYWEGDLRHRTRDGRQVIVSSRLQLILDDEGVRRVLEINRDITERKRAEEALAQRAQELARSNADLAQFAYVASHDLKEPLRAVSGCVGLLKGHYEGKLDERAGEYMTHIVDGAARMETLIDGLLAYSRVGTQGGALQPVECAKALGTAVQNLAASIEESGAVVTHDTLPVVNGDLPQLVSLFQNLIGNALKFRREAPPRIHVSAERNGTHWHFSVRDNGIGIAPQYFERIFGVFQRLHTRREYPGTGIGLALCKKIVERHGGRIWVESVPGEGAAFYFSLLDAQTNHRLHPGEFHA